MSLAFARENTYPSAIKGKTTATHVKPDVPGHVTQSWSMDNVRTFLAVYAREYWTLSASMVLPIVIVA